MTLTGKDRKFRKMKVIGVDNFGRDNVDDILVKENLTECEANKLVEKMNSELNKYSSYFYKVKADNYKLFIWEP